MKKWLISIYILCLGFQSGGTTQAQKLLALVPDYVNVQYAGSVGWLSAGIDYDILKGKGRLGGRYGFVPKPQGGPLHLISSSLFYEPLTLKLSPT